MRENLRPFRIPVFRRTLGSWLNLLIDTGFTIERRAEPSADDEAIERCPQIADTRIIAYFLTIRGDSPPAARRVAADMRCFASLPWRIALRDKLPSLDVGGI